MIVTGAKEIVRGALSLALVTHDVTVTSSAFEPKAGYEHPAQSLGCEVRQLPHVFAHAPDDRGARVRHLNLLRHAHGHRMEGEGEGRMPKGS